MVTRLLLLSPKMAIGLAELFAYWAISPPPSTNTSMVLESFGSTMITRFSWLPLRISGVAGREAIPLLMTVNDRTLLKGTPVGSVNFTDSSAEPVATLAVLQL